MKNDSDIILNINQGTTSNANMNILPNWMTLIGDNITQV